MVDNVAVQVGRLAQHVLHEQRCRGGRQREAAALVARGQEKAFHTWHRAHPGRARLLQRGQAGVPRVEARQDRSWLLGKLSTTGRLHGSPQPRGVVPTAR